MKPGSVPFADTHCHLNMGAFEQDLPEVIERAQAIGIQWILIPGTNLETSQQAVELAEKNAGVYAAVGFHPHDADRWEESAVEKLRKLAHHPKVVAIGEIGLDYYRNYSEPELQRFVLQKQLSLANELQLPVVVHNRDAISDLLKILIEWAQDLPDALANRAGVLHAYSSDADSASKAIDMGFYIGIAGPITFRNAEALRKLVGELPLERILTETDAPYLTPDPHRGKRNEPSYVQFVATAIANTFQVELDQAKEQTAVNARALFKWNHEITDRNIL